MTATGSHTLLLFSLIALIGIATPGPTVLLALSNGSRLGVRRSVPGMVGAVLSDFVLISAVGIGLGAVLAASAMLFSLVKWIGVTYLAYLGIRLLRTRGTLAVPIETGPGRSTSPRAVFLRSFLVAVTNPKGYLFFSAFLPQFVTPTEAQFQQYVTLALTFSFIDLVIMFAYASAGARAVRFLRARGALWLDRLCGGTLLALATSLALYKRRA